MLNLTPKYDGANPALNLAKHLPLNTAQIKQMLYYTFDYRASHAALVHIDLHELTVNEYNPLYLCW